MANSKIDLTRKIEVENITNGSVMYESAGSKVRDWARTGEKKLIPLEELQEAMFTSGGALLFTNGHLLIRDTAARDFLGLPTNPAHLLDKTQTITLVKGPIDKLVEIMSAAPVKVNELIADAAIAVKITDLDKMDIIQKYSGVDVQAEILALRAATEVEVAEAKKTTSKK